MRLLTAVFVGLVILPGMVLGWFGLRYADSLESQARAAIERDLAREMKRQEKGAREAAARVAELIWTTMENKARQWARDLPFWSREGRWIERFEFSEPLIEVRAEVEAVDASGRPIGHRDLVELPEWERFVAVRDAAAFAHWSGAGPDSRKLLLDAEASFVSPRLRERVRSLDFDRGEGAAEGLAQRMALPHGGHLLIHSKMKPRRERFETREGIVVERVMALGLGGGGFGVLDETFKTDNGFVHVTLRHPAAAEFSTAALQRQLLVGGGVFALVMLMLIGLLLARNAFAREQAARRLRDAFIANVSHELKTPLTSVRMYAEMLEEDLPAEKRKEYGRVVDAEGARLAALVDDMLDFAALERGAREVEVEPTDITRAARDCWTAWKPLADRAGVEFEFEGAEWVAMADSTALGRILNNLIQNALKYGGDRIRLVVDGAVSVCDDGPGIVGSERRAIFERFRRGADAGNRAGTGIGLSLSRELAEAMGGTLELEDDGQWTRFTLRLKA